VATGIFSTAQPGEGRRWWRNQVAKGFTQLGMVRVGGVYELEGAMNNSEQYYRPVLETLSALVREGAKP
jgi:hypothetical protein